MSRRMLTVAIVFLLTGLFTVPHAQAALLLSLDARQPGSDPNNQWLDLSGNNAPLLPVADPVINPGGGLPVYNSNGGGGTYGPVYEFGRSGLVHWFETQGGDHAKFNFPAATNGQPANPAGEVTVVAYFDNTGFTDNGPFWSKGSPTSQYQSARVFHGGLSNTAELGVGFTNQSGDRAMSQATAPDDPIKLDLWVLHFDGSGFGGNFETYYDGGTTNLAGPLAGNAAMNGTYDGNTDPLHIGSTLGLANNNDRFFGDLQFIEVYSGSTIDNNLVSGMSPQDYSAHRFNNLASIVELSSTSQWITDGLGDWNDPLNWSPQTVPNGATRTANLGAAITGDSTLVVDSSVTLNRLQFDDDNKYAVAGTQDITFATDPTVPDPTLEVISGGHEIQVKTNLSADLSVTVDASSTLDFNNQIDLNGMTLDTTGGAGTVNINHSTVGGGSITAASVLGTAGSTSLGGSLSSSGTLAIDLGFTSTDRFDVTGAATISGTLDVTLEAGFTPSSDVTILTASSVDTTGLTLNDPSGFFSGFDSSSGTSIILKLASGLDGDFDGSGFVDGLDFLLWQRNPAVGDLADWENNYGTGSLSASTAAVPEPSTAVLFSLAGVVVFAALRQRKEWSESMGLGKE